MILRTLIAASGLMLASTVAVAGYLQPLPVAVDLDSKVAIGDMATARFSENDIEFIGCGTRNPLSFEFAFCQAGDAEGDTVICFTDDPSLISSIRTISDYSFIGFTWEDDASLGARCTSVGTSTQSFYIPDGKSK